MESIYPSIGLLVFWGFAQRDQGGEIHKYFQTFFRRKSGVALQDCPETAPGFAVEILLIVLLWMIFAVFSATLAGAKGYNQAGWAWAGLFFGPIALLATMGLPDLRLRKYIRLLAEHQGAVDVEVSGESPAVGIEDADAQRRRILGQK